MSSARQAAAVPRVVRLVVTQEAGAHEPAMSDEEEIRARRGGGAPGPGPDGAPSLYIGFDQWELDPYAWRDEEQRRFGQ